MNLGQESLYLIELSPLLGETVVVWFLLTCICETKIEAVKSSLYE